MKGSKSHGKSHSPAAEARRVAADKRLVEHGKFSPIELLVRLEERGHGHCKEATRLREQLTSDLPGGTTTKPRRSKRPAKK